MTTAKDVMKMIKDNDVKYVDFRFTDPRGKWQHVTFDVTMIDDSRSALDRARATIEKNLARQVEKKTIDASARDAALGRIAVNECLQSEAGAALIVEAGSSFAFSEPGTVSLLARGGDGSIFDFIDVTAEDIAEVQVFRGGSPVTEIRIPVDAAYAFGAASLGASGTPLSGALTWSWTSAE